MEKDMAARKTTTTKQDSTKEALEKQESNPEVEELVKANEEFAKREEEREAELAALREQLSAAKNNPVSMPDRMESEEQQVGQDGVRSFNEDGVLEKVDQKNLDDPFFKAKAEILQFMEEPVTVEIHESFSEDGDNVAFPISVNNQTEWFIRGQQKTVKRKFVEGLARAKKTTYGNKLHVDPSSGEQEYVHPSRTGLRFPFSIVEDRNPKGRDWFKATLRQP